MEIIPAVETAKLIRSQFKKEFPDSKISVTTEKSTNTRIINVKWQDGVAYDKVEKILEQFRGRKYDGITDTTIFTGTKWQGKQVCFNTYINVERKTTQAFCKKIREYAINKYGKNAENLIIIASADSSRFDINNRFDFEWLLLETNKIINNSDHDRVFDWEGEKIIEEQIKADQEYLDSLEAPEEHCAYIDIETKNFHVECISPRFLTTDYYFYQGKIKVGNYPNWYDLPAFESRGVVWEFHVRFFKLNELKIMTLQELKFNLQDLKAKINPIEPISIDQLIKPVEITGKQVSCKDINNTEEMLAILKNSQEILNSDNEKWYYSKAQVTEVINLTPILKEQPDFDCKVVSIKKYDQFTNNLEKSYKFWLQQQIEKNQLSEIMNFESWKYIYDSQQIKANYLEFIKKCVDEGWADNIISFADWLIYLFQED